MAIGTARMASLCLPAAELHVGLCFEERPAVQRALADAERPAFLLFPGPGAVDVAEAPPDGPRTLVVLDGTWAHARKLLQANPSVAALPRYAFHPARPSEYRIRREPHETYVSTIEALATVLGVLEGDPRPFRAMLRPFRRMIQTQIDCARRRSDARYQRARTRNSPTRVLPRDLSGDAERLVCVAAEANAWPARPGGAGAGREGHHELVQWVATRLGTSEVLDVIVAPRSGLAPSTLGHTGLSARDITAGLTPEELFARWRAFLRPDDVLCTWGAYPASVLAAAGGDLGRRRYDLRQILRGHAAPPFGPIGAWLDRAGVEPPAALARGRAGRRVAEIRALLEALREDDAGVWRRESPTRPVPARSGSAGGPTLGDATR